jgi:hypothetical protein
LHAALIAMAEHRALELGVEVNTLSLDGVLVSDDEKAVAREFGNAAAESGVTTEIGPDETLDHVVARLAVGRGWIIMDAARAILGDADARVDDPKSSAPCQGSTRAGRRTQGEQATRRGARPAAPCSSHRRPRTGHAANCCWRSVRLVRQWTRILVRDTSRRRPDRARSAREDLGVGAASTASSASRLLSRWPVQPMLDT